MMQSDQFQSTPEPRNRGPVSLCFSSLGTGWRWVAQMSQRIEESWVGDLLALICLAATIYVARHRYLQSLTEIITAEGFSSVAE